MEDLNSLSDVRLARIIWQYMRFEQQPHKVDLIIGLGNADIRTAEHCAKLYLDGYAPRIIFTGARGKITRELFSESEADVFSRRAIELGVPRRGILKESSATNTGENIINCAKLLSSMNFDVKSVILVTKPYMLRRAYATFMKQWPSQPAPKVFCSAVSENFEEYSKNREVQLDTISIMVGDLQRIREYPKLGFQIEQKIPEHVWLAGRELARRGYDKHLLYRESAV